MMRIKEEHSKPGEASVWRQRLDVRPKYSRRQSFRLEKLAPPLPSFTIKTPSLLMWMILRDKQKKIDWNDGRSLPVRVMWIRLLRVRRWREEHFLVDGYLRRRDFGFICILFLSILDDWLNNLLVHLSASQQHWWLFQPQQTLTYIHHSDNC